MTDSFIVALARPQPDPGGGAAAAYGASVGLALLEKVCLIELQRSVEPSGADDCWDSLTRRTEQLKTDLAELIVRDSRAYAALSRAKKSGAVGLELTLAIREAAECPTEIAEAGLAALDIAAEAGTRCRRHLTPDVQVVCELLTAAIRGACHIARANALSMKTAEERSQWIRKLGHLGENADQRCAGILQELETRSAETE